jgi:LysM repeat protein
MRKLIFAGIFALMTMSAYAIPQDSLRLEIDKNKKKAWIIHRVEPKETVYSLSRRYKVSIDDIYTENPSAKNLKVSDLLRIPYKDFEKGANYTAPQNDKAETHTVETGETLYKIAQKYNINIKNIQKWNSLDGTDIRVGQVLALTAPKTDSKVIENVAQSSHIVKEDEYLYTISKKYGVKLTELKEWNGLDTPEKEKLKIGQKLDIFPTGYKKTEKNPDLKNNEVKNTDVKETKTESETSRQNINIAGYNKVVEKGMAEVIEDEKVANYCGLHKDAPVGTIVAVKNETTGESVFVRIVGKLPSVGNDKTLIKISKNVYNALGAKGERFSVEISYIP